MHSRWTDASVCSTGIRKRSNIRLKVSRVQCGTQTASNYPASALISHAVTLGLARINRLAGCPGGSEIIHPWLSKALRRR